jgi:hypothetical protein
MLIPLQRETAPRAATFTSTLLAPEPTELARDAQRFGAGLMLAGVFGLALGARFGLAAMAVHAMTVPIALLAVTGFGGPAFYIALLHGGLAIDALGVARAFARGTATAGLALAGFAPPMALFSLSCEETLAVQAYAALGLGAAGALGLRALLKALPASPHSRLLGPKLCLAAFATLLSARVWLAALPIFGGLR